VSPSADTLPSGVFRDHQRGFYSARHCASTYLYSFPWMEEQKFARQMQNDMLQQIQEARPKFLVYADCARSWGTKATLEDNWGLPEMAWA
jgi:hypothetical protein